MFRVRPLHRSLAVSLAALSVACSSSSEHRRVLPADAGPDVTPIIDGAPPGAGGRSALLDAALLDAQMDALPPGTGGARDAGRGADASDASAAVGVYVDSTNGLDTNSGVDRATALKTLHKAVSIAQAGNVIWMADGPYAAATEGGGVIDIPSGVTVEAENDGLVTIDGQTLTANGASGGLVGLVLQGSALTVADAVDTAASVSLVRLRFVSTVSLGATLVVSGNTNVTMVTPQFSGNLRFGTINLASAASLTIQGGSFDAGGVGAPAYGAALILATGTTKLTLDGVTMKSSLTPGIGAAGSSPATPIVVTLRNGTVLDTVGSPGNCAAAGAVILSANASLFVDASRIDNSPSAGVCVRNGASSNVSVDIRNGVSFKNDARAIASEIGSGSQVALTMNGVTLSQNAAGGIYWEGWGTFDIRNTTFSGNAAGLYLATNQPVTLTVRGSTFTASNNAVQLFLAAPSTVDFGTQASPGNNVLTGSTTASLSVNVPVAQVVDASGNTWAASEGADPSGHYAAGTKIVGPVTLGANYRLTNASTLAF